MKKFLNCKIILALAICLTMFAGLAITASANPICGTTETTYVGTTARYCSSAHCCTDRTHYKYKCSGCGNFTYACNFCGKITTN